MSYVQGLGSSTQSTNWLMRKIKASFSIKLNKLNTLPKGQNMLYMCYVCFVIAMENHDIVNFFRPKNGAGR